MKPLSELFHLILLPQDYVKYAYFMFFFLYVSIHADQAAVMDGNMMMKVKQAPLKNEFQMGAAATSIATCSS